MEDKYKAQRVARMLHDISQQMTTVSEYMFQNDLNLKNYPQNWNSFDEMGEMLTSVIVYSENDNDIQEMVGDN